MEYIHGTEDFKLDKPSAVTLGKFDGVHLGHQKLISIVREKADELGLLSVMFTFDRIPLSICPQKNQHFLSTNSERRNLCENYGLDVEVEYPFTTELMNMEPDDFIKDILVDKLKAKVLVVGTDYCFGKNRSGNVEFLIKNAADSCCGKGHIRLPLCPCCCSPATSKGFFLFPLQFCRFFAFPAKFSVYSGTRQKTPEFPHGDTLVQHTKQRRNALEPVSNCQVRHHRSAGGRDVRHGARPPWHGVLSVPFRQRPQHEAERQLLLLLWLWSQWRCHRPHRQAVRPEPPASRREADTRLRA